jgi:radical SAM superfamily enzyme YgiQ (UPF0313 family)
VRDANGSAAEADKTRNLVLAGIQPPAMRRTLALRYLKSYAESIPDIRKRWRVSVSDFSLDGTAEEVAERVLAERPAFVGFSCYLWNIEMVLKACARIKRRLPDVPIVLGGPEASAHAERLLKDVPEIDFVCLGEGEEVLPDLVCALERPRPELRGVLGLVHREGGKPVRNADRPLITDLNRIPPPFPEDSFQLYEGERLVCLEASRGCPFDCKFCDWRTNQKTRNFSIERVQREVELVAATGASIFMCDADVLMLEERARKMYGSFIRTSGRGSIVGNTYLPLLRPSLVPEVNSYRIALGCGVETTNPKSLHSMTRRFDRKKYESVIEQVHEQAGMLLVQIQLMFGLPMDNLEGVRDSLEWALSVHPREVALYPTQVLAGSGMGMDPAAYGLTEIEKEPPYRILATSSCPREEMIQIEELAIRFGLLQDTAPIATVLEYVGEALRDQGKRPFLDLYESFAERLMAWARERLAEDDSIARKAGCDPNIIGSSLLRDERFRAIAQAREAEVTESLRLFSLEKLEAGGRAEQWPALERFFQTRANRMHLSGAKGCPGFLDAFPEMSSLSRSGPWLWLGWTDSNVTAKGCEDLSPPLRATILSHASTRSFRWMERENDVLLHAQELGQILEKLEDRSIAGTQWNGVVAAGVLSCVAKERRRAFLERLARAVRPGGFLFVWDDLLGPSPLDVGVKSVREALRTPPAAAAVATAAEIARDIRATGWEVEGSPQSIRVPGGSRVSLFRARLPAGRPSLAGRGAARSRRP